MVYKAWIHEIIDLFKGNVSFIESRVRIIQYRIQ